MASPFSYLFHYQPDPPAGDVFLPAFFDFPCSPDGAMTVFV